MAIKDGNYYHDFRDLLSFKTIVVSRNHADYSFVLSHTDYIRADFITRFRFYESCHRFISSDFKIFKDYYRGMLNYTLVNELDLRRFIL